MASAEETASAKIASRAMSRWQLKFKTDHHFRCVIKNFLTDVGLAINGQRAHFYMPAQSCKNRDCWHAKNGSCTFGPEYEMKAMDFFIGALYHGYDDYFTLQECFNREHMANGKCVHPMCASVGKGKTNWLTQAQKAVNSLDPKNARGKQAPFFGNSKNTEVTFPKRGWGDQPIDVGEVEEKAETPEQQPLNPKQICLIALERIKDTKELLVVLEKELPALREASKKYTDEQNAAATLAETLAEEKEYAGLLAKLAVMQAKREKAAKANEAEVVP
jgi:hypothetical protein